MTSRQFVAVSRLRSGERVQQRLRLLQIARVEAFREPAVNWSKQFARLPHLALVAPEAREAHCGAQFPGLCPLLTSDGKRAFEIRFRFRDIRFRRHLRDFARHAMNFSFAPPFVGCFNRRHRFTNAAPSVIELAEFPMSPSQIC